MRFKTLETLLDDAIKSILYYIRRSKIYKNRKKSLSTKIHNHVRIKQTSNYLISKIEEIPTLLSSSAPPGELVHEIDDKQIIPYTEIPNFPVSTVEGHRKPDCRHIRVKESASHARTFITTKDIPCSRLLSLIAFFKR